MKLLLLISLIFAFSLEAQPSLKLMKKEKRVAFVIVNDKYQGLEKNKAIYGKNSINKFLKNSGFETIYLRNATRTQMIKALRAFRDILSKESIALFYYSGHAIEINGKNYLLPVDTINDFRDATKMKIELQAILHVMGRFSSRKNMVLIDNIDNRVLRKKFKVKKIGLSKIKAPKNTDLVITNKPNSISSYLTKSSLSTGVSNKEGSRSFKSIDPQAYVKLSKNTFYFSVPNTLKKRKPKVSKEDVLWATILKNNTMHAYQTYISNFPQGKYIAQAQVKLDDFEAKLKVQKRIDLALKEKKSQELKKREKEKLRLLAQKKAKKKAKKKTNSYIEPKMVNIYAGTYKMGCSLCSNHNERPLHFVRIKEDFSIGKYEVSNAEYNVYLLSMKKKTRDAGNNLPVVNVSWEDAIAYASWLSQKTGKKYTLPSESQWEYVSRAGGKTKYFWGKQGSQFDAYAWAKDNSGYTLHKVGQKEPNPWGIYDLSGNASEWCLDDYRLDYAQKSHNKHNKVVRGGSFLSGLSELRVSYRFFKPDTSKHQDIGFRLVLN